MSQCIDGFVLPIPRNNLNEYRRLVEAVAAIWKEHGALDYREYVCEDLVLDSIRTFADLADADEDDVIVFGWVEFESREARDRANDKVAADPRLPDLINSTDSGFDAERMAYGCFRTLVS